LWFRFCLSIRNPQSAIRNGERNAPSLGDRPDSGSSGDGVDGALVELDGTGLEVSRASSGLHQSYPPELRELVQRTSGSAPCLVARSAR